MSKYDKYYKTKDLFGEPYFELIEFFKQYEPKGSLIDLGCGQGRDAIPLARLGYKITGIDNSKVGIEQLNTISKKERLNITGLYGDIYSLENYQDFDIVLLDSMLHFEKRDLERETNLITKIAKRIGIRGLICVCIQDKGQKVKILKETFKKSEINFDILNDSTLYYSYVDKESGYKSVSKYCMYILKKK